MIIVLKQDAPDVQVREFCHELEDMACRSTIPRAATPIFWVSSAILRPLRRAGCWQTRW